MNEEMQDAIDNDLFGCAPDCCYCNPPNPRPVRAKIDQGCPRRPPNNPRNKPKRQTARLERRRAKLDPECQPLYRGFRGYES